MSISVESLPSHLQSLIQSAEYKYAIDVLSRFGVPDFSDWPPAHRGIFGGWFLAGFRQNGVDLDCFTRLAEDVAKLSEGTVTLQNVITPYERFWVNGSIACYLYMESPPLPRKKVCFGPSLQPFKLDTSQSKYDTEDNHSKTE